MTTELPPLRATTSDIARLAGVSRATVSHILNNHRSKFSPETEARVLAALDELKYRPSMSGRALANGRSDLLIVVLPTASLGLRVQDALDRVVAQAAELGASVLTRFAGPDAKSTLDALLYLQPIAVMNLGGLGQDERVELERAGIAVIPSASRLTAANVVNPDELVGSLQVDVLHRTKERIVIASLQDARTDSPFLRARAEAVATACDAHGLARPSIVHVELDRDAAVSALRDVFAEGPVGFACYNDEVATAVLAAARRLGYSVPHDVAVVGVDVTPLGQLLDPPLTSVMVDVDVAIDYNMSHLRELMGRPDAVDAVLTDVVTLHPGGTA